MKTIDLIQGSPEWAAHRSQHWNASDAPAMLNCSPHLTRDQLLHRLHTGISPDVDPATQRRFDDGHRFEALARPLAEAIIGEDLYPVTGTNGKLSASFDGITLLEDVAFEHKSLNDSLRYTPWDEGNGDHLPLHYRVQMEHQLIVSGAKCVLFMASRWAFDEMVEERHCWYASDPKLRAQILAGWDQFSADLAVYVHTPIEVKPTGRAPDALPALLVQVTGMVTASNLAEFKAVALGAIAAVNRDLQTDQDFADAEKSVKWCTEIESRIAATKDHALSQTASIDQLFRAMDDISAEARRVRLDLSALVKARKEAVKAEIVAAGRDALDKHLCELESAMPAKYMPDTVPADFGGCIKGLRTIDSIRNAVNSELARAKIEAGAIATRIHANIKTLADCGLVIHDAATLVLKAPDDLAAVIAQRWAVEQANEAAQRERIRAEEAARLEREAQAERKVREAAEEMARQRDQREADELASAAEQAAQAMQRAAAPSALPPPPAPPAPVAAAPTADTGSRIALGQINRRLDPVQITAAGLAALGFDPVGKERASVLYRESDFLAIKQAIARHVLAVPCVQSLALQSA